MAKKVASPVGPVAAPRNYRSPLRERQAAQTRDTILTSVADEILERGIHGLSMSAVAARAEVAERTIYRYFESTEALLDALIESVGTKLVALLGNQPRLRPGGAATVDELVAHLPALYIALDEIGAPARAVAVVTLARGSDPGRQQRRELLAKALAPELAHLDAATAYAMVETLYLLGGSVSWYLLTRSGELDGSHAGEAAARAIRAILADLRRERGDEPAGHPQPGRA